MFCALWPKRPIVPSLPFLFGCPEIEFDVSSTLGRPRMPSACLACAASAWLLHDLAIRDGFDQAGAEQRGRNAEHDVVARHLGCEVGLSDIAAERIGPAGDREQAVHPAVGRSVGVAHETHFAHRAVGAEERRYLVARAGGAGKRDLRIHGRAAAADGGVGMAAAAAVEIHRRPQAFFDVLGFIEVVLRRLERRQLGRRQAVQRAAGVTAAAARPGVLGVGRRRRPARRAATRRSATAAPKRLDRLAHRHCGFGRALDLCRRGRGVGGIAGRLRIAPPLHATNKTAMPTVPMNRIMLPPASSWRDEGRDATPRIRRVCNDPTQWVSDSIRRIGRGCVATPIRREPSRPRRADRGNGFESGVAYKLSST